MGELLIAAAEGESFDLALWGVLLATGALLLLAYRTAIPYPTLLLAGGAILGMAAHTAVEHAHPRLRGGVHPRQGGRHGARASARARPRDLPAAAPVLRGVLLLAPRPARQ